jgi:hypothetical protein
MPKFRGMATLHPAFIMRSQELLPVAAADLAKSLDIPDENYSPYPSLEEVQTFTATRFSMDIEIPRYRTLGDRAPIELVGLCDKPGHALSVPVRGQYTSELRRIFRNAKTCIGFNSLQFDLPRLREIDIKTSEECEQHDLMLQQHLLQPDLPHSLAFVASVFTNKPYWKNDKVTGGWELYNCKDVDATFLAWLEVFALLK